MLGVNKQTSREVGEGTPSNTLFVGGLTREMTDEEIKNGILSCIPPAMKIKQESLFGTTNFICTEQKKTIYM